MLSLLPLRKKLQQSQQSQPPRSVWVDTFLGTIGKDDGTIETDVLGVIWVHCTASGIDYQVYNDIAPTNRYGLQVEFGRQVDEVIWHVIRVFPSYEDPANQASTGELIKSIAQDQFIRTDHLLVFLTTPIDGGGSKVRIYGANITKSDGTPGTIPNYDEYDLSSYHPASGARWARIDADEDGVIHVTTGSTKAAKELLTPDDIPAKPSGYIPSCAVRLYNQTQLYRISGVIDDFVDLREFINGSGGGSGGGITSVNGDTGPTVVLNQDDIGDGTTYKQYSDTEKTKLAGIEAGATKYPDTGEEVYSSAEKTKLAGIETGAEVNNISDANATDLTDGGETTLHTHPSSGGSAPNKADNSQFAVAQRGTSFTSATTPANNDAAYLFDRYINLSDGNNIFDLTQETSVVPLGATTALRLQVKTANKRGGQFQIFESSDSADFIASGVASLSFVARKAALNTTVDSVRAVVLSWTGTKDAPTKDWVSAWGTEGNNPTAAANWTIEGSAVFTLTNSYQTFKLENVAIDTANVKNVGLFLMVENGDGTVSDILYLTNIWFGASATAPTYSARGYGTEFLACQRQLLRLAPGSAGALLASGRVSSATNDTAVFAIVLPVPFRTTPTPTQVDLMVATATDGNLNITAVDINAYNLNVINVRTTSSNLTVSNEPAFLRANTNTACLELSAEIGV